MKVLVIGGSNIDYLATSHNHIILKDSNIGSIVKTFGGVGRNIVENLNYLGVDVTFITALGKDNEGLSIKKHLKSLGVNIVSSNSILPTSKYIAVSSDDGDMYVAISDMEIMESIDIKLIKKYDKLISSYEYIIFDTNLSQEVIEYLVNNYQAKFIVDAISTSKALRLLNVVTKLYLLKCNNQEYQTLCDHKVAFPEYEVITKGNEKTVYYIKGVYNEIEVPFVNNIINTTGSGDAFLSGVCYKLLERATIKEAIIFGQQCAKITLQSALSVSESIKDLLEK